MHTEIIVWEYVRSFKVGECFKHGGDTLFMLMGIHPATTESSERRSQFHYPWADVIMKGGGENTIYAHIKVQPISLEEFDA